MSMNIKPALRSHFGGAGACWSLSQDMSTDLQDHQEEIECWMGCNQWFKECASLRVLLIRLEA